MARIALLVHPNRPEAKTLADRASGWLESANHEVLVLVPPDDEEDPGGPAWSRPGGESRRGRDDAADGKPGMGGGDAGTGGEPRTPRLSDRSGAGSGSKPHSSGSWRATTPSRTG